MKKLFTLLLTLILCVTACCAFGCNEQKAYAYTFVAPDGAPAIAVSKLINDKDKLSTKNGVAYNIVSGQEIQTYLASGRADIALVPVNLASNLYNKHDSTNPYVMVAVITHGNFYIMSTEQITVNDLAGKKIAVPMPGAVPDWTLQMALKNNNVQAGEFSYYSDASKIVPMLLQGKETIGLIPEPAATALTKNAQKQNKTIYRLDLQELYDSQEKAYPQAVLMVKKSVIEYNADLIDALENKITQSVVWAKNDAAAAVSAISTLYETTLQAPALSAQVIDACKIYWQSAEQAKASVEKYINAIIEIDQEKATAVTQDFFYISK